MAECVPNACCVAGCFPADQISDSAGINKKMLKTIVPNAFPIGRSGTRADKAFPREPLKPLWIKTLRAGASGTRVN